MRVCPRCRSVYAAPAQWCALDQTPLEDWDHDPLVGRRVDRYDVVDVLGEGGMGRVYRARHAHLAREYAIKVLFGEFASDPKFAERFRREAHGISRIRHPNVVSVEDFGHSPEGLTFIALELVPGESLDRLLARRGALTPREAALIVRQLVEGLGAAHAVGIVHRDIKPQNIMVMPTGEVKILDFGSLSLTDTMPEERLTSVGNIVGTPTYMAPEQSQDEQVGPAADFYAVGVVLYEMLTGERPFQGRTRAEILVKHIAEPPPAAPESEGLEQLVAELLEKRVHARPAKAADVLTRLDALPVAAPPDTGPLPDRDLSQRTQPLYYPNVVTADLEVPEARATTGSEGAPDDGNLKPASAPTPVGAPSSPWTSSPSGSDIDPTRLSELPPLAGTTTDPSDDTPGGGAKARPRRRRGLALGALALVVALGVGAAWYFGSGEPVRVQRVPPRADP